MPYNLHFFFKQLITTQGDTVCLFMSLLTTSFTKISGPQEQQLCSVLGFFSLKKQPREMVKGKLLVSPSLLEI